MNDSILRQNWRRVVDEVHEATDKAGRKVDSVKIVGVTKYVDAETTLELAQAGCLNLGENRPQLLWQKADHFREQSAEPVQWHLIGHLQRNKIRRSLHCNPLVHSVDSERVLKAIGDEAVQQDRVVDALLEVNVSDEESKTGLPIKEAAQLLGGGPPAGVRLIGLMAMAGWGTAPDEAKRSFDSVRELRDRLEEQCDVRLPELSMGMSGDFQQAIEAGATIVRIGTRLFEGILDR